MPRITVIIPTFNWCSVLPFSIGSVLDQTYGDFELLVVGDGCTDGSQEFVESISDQRVRWINLDKNCGDQSGPCNRGCMEARGEWIAYIGHDDIWYPHHLRNLAAIMETGCDMAYSIAICYHDDQICGALPSLFEDYRRPMAIAPSTVIHRRQLIEDVGGWRSRHEARAAMDYDLWNRFFEAGATMRFLPEISAVKFPAALRKDVYLTKPSALQARFSTRVRDEPDLGIAQKDQLLSYLMNIRNQPVGIIASLRKLRNAVLARVKIGQRLGLRPGRQIDAIRRFKGLR